VRGLIIAMSKISKKKVRSAPSLTQESLSKWVDSVSTNNEFDGEDGISDEDLTRLKNICTNRLVTIRLIKILKGVTDAERKSQSFLLAACGRFPHVFSSKIQRTPSLRARQLSLIAKAARALARRIFRKTAEGIIEPGTERVEFVTRRLANPKLIFPPDEAFYDDDLQEPVDLSRMLHMLIGSFANALDGQAQFLLSGAARGPGTPIRHYIDSLIKLCKAKIGAADALLIKHVVYAVTNRSVTRPAVDYRIERLSERGFA
jgi:hypothetical protein